MSTDDSHPGVPTRAIHEAYLDMQRALKQYRQSKDAGNESAIQRSHGDVQEGVLTLYNLLRPHIKNNDAVKEYWNGELPAYNGDGSPPDPEDGAGVLHVQRQTKALSWDDTPIEDVDEIADLDGLEDWHETLSLNGQYRIEQVAPDERGLFVRLQRYRLGLRNLDGWETEQQTRQVTIGGFLGTVTKETTERQRVPMDRLQRAAAELSDVAHDLGALSQFDASTPRTEITKDLIEEMDEWRKQNIES